jgi:hypothetical protein
MGREKRIHGGNYLKRDRGDKVGTLLGREERRQDRNSRRSRGEEAQWE